MNDRVNNHSIPYSVRTGDTAPIEQTISSFIAIERGVHADILDLSRFALGTRLRPARPVRGSRMKDVADAAGYSESLVSKIENNKLEPSSQVLNKLCSVL